LSTRAGPAAVATVLGLVALSCGGADDGDQARHGPRHRLQPCAAEWNRPANFARGRPGRLVRRLRPRPVVPLFAHVSLDGHGRCVVFLDTPSTADDRRFVRTRGRYLLDCTGDCGQDAPPGARTVQFLRDGTLPDL
jgi:hypothetical protein